MHHFYAKTGPVSERFQATWAPVRVKKTRQNKKIEPPFRFNRNGKGSSYSSLSLDPRPQRVRRNIVVVAAFCIGARKAGPHRWRWTSTIASC
jgi:hypothetical protein